MIGCCFVLHSYLTRENSRKKTTVVWCESFAFRCVRMCRSVRIFCSTYFDCVYILRKAMYMCLLPKFIIVSVCICQNHAPEGKAQCPFHSPCYAVAKGPIFEIRNTHARGAHINRSCLRKSNCVMRKA